MDQRIGIGYDSHRLVAGRELVLGGVRIPFELGLLGHSDADALLHAISDALLGAASLGDIGEHFPDTDQKFAGVASSELLKAVGMMLKEKKWRIGNIDAVVLCQEPKLGPFKSEMSQRIAAVLGITPDRVNIKAKTNEGLDAVGRKEAIAVYAVALIVKEG